MTEATLRDCLRLLRAKYAECRQRWQDGSDLLYEAALQDLPDDAARRLRDICLTTDHAPRTDEIRLMLGGQAGRQAGAYKPLGLDRPGFERQRAGASPYDLMREGFDDAWAEWHPGEKKPVEWIAMLRRIGERKTEERRQAIARGDDPAGYDPFGEEAA